MEIKRYLKKVTINKNVMEKLKVNPWRDRLGVFIVFEFNMFPNETISYTTVLSWFKHFFAIVGYTYEHIVDITGDEMCECWVFPRADYTAMHVRHKYLSYQTCMMIKRILWNYCKLYNIPFSYRKLDF